VRYREYLPQPELRAYLDYYWVFETQEGDDLFLRDKFMPETHPFILFQVIGGYRRLEATDRGAFSPIVVSAGSHATEWVELSGRSLSVGVRFRAGGARAMRLFAPGELGGLRSFEDGWARRLAERLASAPVHSDLSIFVPILNDTFRSMMLAIPEGKGEDKIHRFRSVTTGIYRKAGQISIDDMAATYGSSGRHLERACLEYSGYTPVQYRALIRCEIARAVLFASERPNQADLAYALGFCDSAHFCRTFKQWSGLSPGGYARFCSPYRTLMRGHDSMIHLWEQAGAFNPSESVRTGGE